MMAPIVSAPGAPLELASLLPHTSAAAQPALEPQPQRESQPPKQCRLAAFRHGVTRQIFMIAADEAQNYIKHHADVRKHYEPVGPIEKHLADQIASGIWRLQRVAAIEETIFAMDWDATLGPNSEPISIDRVIGPAHTFLTAGKAVDLLGKYEGRLRRALEKDKAELDRLQSQRKDAAAHAMNQAVALHNWAKKENKPYQPEIFFKASPETLEAVFQTETVRLESARREAWSAAQARLKFEKNQK